MSKEYTPAEMRALRDRAGLSRRELAEQFNVAQITIKFWELGYRKPSRMAFSLYGHLEQNLGGLRA